MSSSSLSTVHTSRPQTQTRRVMEVISSGTVRGRGSSSSPSTTLNPNAPMFVPLAYRTVEDFSDQWWDLVRSSPWFRDYWLRERFHDFDPQNQNQNELEFEFEFDDHDPLLLSDHHQLRHPILAELDEGGEEEEEGGKELVSMGALKWRRGGGWAETPRYAEKAPKIVKKWRASPRTIHQPR